MPKQPGFIDKVNGIINYVENPCDAPWIIYFETALPALGTAILTLLDFGFDDVVRGALRPRGLRTRKHTRRGRRGRSRFGGIPELGELIGSSLPGAQEAKGRSVTQGVKNLWIVDGVLQRILWYWLVVDVTVEFFYAWASAINESVFCKKTGMGAAYYKSADDATFFSLGNFWTSPPSNIKVYERDGAEAKAGAHFNQGRSFSGITTIKATPLGIGPGPLELRAIDSFGNIVGSGTPQNNPDGTVSVVLQRPSFSGSVFYSYRTNGEGYVGVCDSITIGT